MPSVDPPSVLYAHYGFRSGPRRFGTRPFNFMLGEYTKGYTMKFKSKLYDWIDASLAQAKNPNELGFNFNLREPYGVEIIGSNVFDEKDPDWPCEETFVPKQRDMNIPNEVCSGTWEECLALMKGLILEYMASKRSGSKILMKSKGVGVCFVDGDMELLYVNKD